MAYTALFLAMSGTAFAATGGTFILGRSNTATTATGLTNSYGTALALASKTGYPPLSVNQPVRIARLNADLLDGLDSTAFQRRISGTCPTGAAATAIAASGSMICAAFRTPIAQVVTVSGGPSSTTNGTKLIQTLASITDSSASKPYDVIVGPGTYDLSGGTLTLPMGIALVGAGISNTTVTTTAADPVTISAQGNNGLRDLTVIATGASSGGTTTADAVVAHGALDMRDVAVDVPTATTSTGMIAIGGAIEAHAVRVSVNATAQAFGLQQASGGSVHFYDGAIEAQLPGPAIGGPYAAFGAADGQIFLVDSQLDPATLRATCFNDYGNNFNTFTCG